MRLQVRQYPDAVLREKGKPVAKIDEDLCTFIQDMIQTMNEANGVGLAAQQVGTALQLFVVDVSIAEEETSTLKLNGEPVNPNLLMPLVLLNSAISYGSGKVTAPEACLSFPRDISGEVTRPAQVCVSAQTVHVQNRNAEFVKIEATGLLARVLQHEFDHTNGVLFIDRMNALQKVRLQKSLKQIVKAAKSSTSAKEKRAYTSRA